MADTRPINLTVNGERHAGEVETRMHLADFLRQSAGLTGTHLGCEHGVCGACTVIVDGEAVRSCLMLAVQANGTSVTTIEGLADGSVLHPVQRAFQENHGCSAGSARRAWSCRWPPTSMRTPNPTNATSAKPSPGNICRCTGYQGIVAAGLQAAVEIRTGSASGGEV